MVQVIALSTEQNPDITLNRNWPQREAGSRFSKLS